MGDLKLPEWAVEQFSCPKCGRGLAINGGLRCLDEECGLIFPIINGVPILLHPEISLFSPNDYLDMKDTYFKGSRNSFFRTLLRLSPNISANIKATRNYRKLTKLLLKSSERPRGLVLGGGIVGKGMEELLASPVELVETDVSFGPRTMAIVDAHCIPFNDDSFDFAVAQALLEHVLDPYACVREIYRIIKPGGFIYTETAFMQQVHEGAFDFTRFTSLGHRRLFAGFHEIESGAVCGTGMALAWAYEYFLMSLLKSATLRKAARLFARLTAFWLKYFDYMTIDNPTTLDAASGLYFIGRKSGPGISDKDLIQTYAR